MVGLVGCRIESKNQRERSGIRPRKIDDRPDLVRFLALAKLGFFWLVIKWPWMLLSRLLMVNQPFRDAEDVVVICHSQECRSLCWHHPHGGLLCSISERLAISRLSMIKENLESSDRKDAITLILKIIL